MLVLLFLFTPGLFLSLSIKQAMESCSTYEKSNRKRELSYSKLMKVTFADLCRSVVAYV